MEASRERLRAARRSRGQRVVVVVVFGQVGMKGLRKQQSSCPQLSFDEEAAERVVSATAQATIHAHKRPVVVEQRA